MQASPARSVEGSPLPDEYHDGLMVVKRTLRKEQIREMFGSGDEGGAGSSQGSLARDASVSWGLVIIFI